MSGTRKWAKTAECAFYPRGAVAASNAANQCSATSRVSPHISEDGCNPLQQAGRSAQPNNRQRNSLSRCRQGTPAGLFSEEIEGAIQQAAHPLRHSISL
jgi:hypothetical protein